MPNLALEPGESEIPLPGVVPRNPDQTLEKLGPVSHAAGELEEIGEKKQPPAFQGALRPFEASGPITQRERRDPKNPVGKPARPGSPGVSP
jgi:hypothetical protein